MSTPRPRIEGHWLPNKALTRPRFFTPTSVVLTLCFLETLSQGYWRVIMKGEKKRSEYRIGSLNRSGLSSLLPALLPLLLPLLSPFIHVFLLWTTLSLSKFEWNTRQTGTVFHWSLIVQQLFNFISSRFLPCPRLSLSFYTPLRIFQTTGPLWQQTKEATNKERYVWAERAKRGGRSVCLKAKDRVIWRYLSWTAQFPVSGTGQKYPETKKKKIMYSGRKGYTSSFLMWLASVKPSL